MRVWMSLVLLVSMMGVSCGDSDEKVSPDGASNGGNSSGEANGLDASAGVTAGGSSDAAQDDSWKSCDRDMIKKELQTYQGPMPMFSQADADRCAETCLNQSDDCYSEKNCPGIDLWETCLNRNAFACSASDGGACRTEYENVECCGLASACKDLSCVDDKCPAEAAALRDCRAADTACKKSASSACFSAS